MRYKIHFHTPVGTFSTKVKDSPEYEIQKKMSDYCEEKTLREGITITTDSSQIILHYNILSQSVIEFGFNV